MPSMIRIENFDSIEIERRRRKNRPSRMATSGFHHRSCLRLSSSASAIESDGTEHGEIDADIEEHDRSRAALPHRR